MSTMAKFTLMFVVFVDLIGQGLVFPIINSLIMEPSSALLPETTSMARRHFDYGLVIGSFFLAWFLGVVYVSKVSDSIGRKRALLVCLGGAFIGYVITIVALVLNSLWLLVIGRVVTGFTAGNQPIAQAAMIDGSSDAADRDCNVGYIVTGVSFGLVAGPIIGGVFSDKKLLGSEASVYLPFCAAIVLVVLAAAMVTVFFHDVRAPQERFVFRPRDVLDSLLAVRDHPLVMRLMPAYVLFMIANVTFYIFIDNYLTSAFGYGIVGGSAIMLTIGAAIAISSAFFVKPVQERFDKRWIVGAGLAVMVVCAIAVALVAGATLTFPPVFLFYAFFGVAYPTLLGAFSSSVDASDQGWVMGVTTAVFCLAGGIMSLLGSGLMDINIRLPFYVAAISALLGLVATVLTWRSTEVRQLMARPAPAASAE